MHPITTKLKDRVDWLKSTGVSMETIKISLKELLQDYVLAAIYSNPNFKDFIFIGGTALKKLHNLNRFSEDLDFSTTKPVDYLELGNWIVKYFNQLDFQTVDYNIQQNTIVSRLTLKFAILKDVGLSPLSNEKLHVKVETTASGKDDLSIMMARNLSGIPIAIKTYPLEVMMEGKINACLTRIYKKGKTPIKIKGRDYYDLIWYMEKKIIPSNVSVFKELDTKISTISSEHLYIDLAPYFEDKAGIKSWCDNFHNIYELHRGFYDSNSVTQTNH